MPLNQFTCWAEDGGGCSQKGSDTNDCCVQALFTLGGGRVVVGGGGGGDGWYCCCGGGWERFFMDDVDGVDWIERFDCSLALKLW